ncbi:Pentatricopeptide repeat-containing protein [Arachis hypogaea]|nr:Pentatricopeptide repeat-containing protein [Arachis hypogaea]
MTSPSLHRSFLRSPKTLVTLSSHRIISFNFSKNPNQQSFYSSRSNFPFESPSRVQKLIASQSDPLLAKEIFECASRHPNFRHSYSTYLILILKLGRSRQFSLVDDLVRRLKSESYPITPTLFSYLIRVYGEADLPDKTLKTFYTMLQYGFKPLPKHLNRILAILVSHRNFVRPAFDLFRDAHRHGVSPNTHSYNILMRAFCLNGDVSIAYHLFNKMFKRDIVPDIECYRILMQAMCRKSQVNGAMDLFEDMLNKGFVPDSLTYTTLLNSLCRKKKLREAYKLLCRMKIKGCNPDINNGCLPNVVSYRTLVGGLCDKGMLDEANNYMKEMLSKGFSPHFAVIHGLVKGFCNVGKIKEACGVLTKSLEHGEASHMDTWAIIIPLICDVDDGVRCRDVLEQVLKIEITGHTRIVDAGIGLENYLIRKIRANPRAS